MLLKLSININPLFILSLIKHYLIKDITIQNIK